MADTVQLGPSGTQAHDGVTRREFPTSTSIAAADAATRVGTSPIHIAIRIG